MNEKAIKVLENKLAEYKKENSAIAKHSSLNMNGSFKCSGCSGSCYGMCAVGCTGDCKTNPSQRPAK